MFRQSTDKRVAVFVAEGLEESEGLTVVDLLFRAGIPCDTVSIVEDHGVTSSHQVRITCDRSIYDEGFSFDDYDMLVLPGGMPGTLNLGACEPLCGALKRFAAEGRQVAAICAAPTVLAKLGILEGRRATCFPGMEDALVEHGAKLTAGAVVVDGNVTTSRGMGTAIDFGLRIVGHYLGEEPARALAAKIVYRA